MSTTDKWTNEYNDKEFAVKLENFASEFEQTRFGKINENTITDTETRKITRQIEYCKYVLQRLDNHKNELKPFLAEAYKKYKTVLIETLDFWNSQEWFEIAKNELELDDKAERDLKIHERLRKLAFDCDNEKENFKSNNTTALKINELVLQIERFEFAFSLLEKKKEKDNLFLVEEFGKYEPVLIEVLDYWKAELTKLQSGNVPREGTTKPPTKEKTLSELITHQNSVEIVEGIKIQYKNIKGKQLKLLLLALQELHLLPKERIATKFYNCCKAEFGWDVASYPAMNDYQFNERTDLIELDRIKLYLETKIKAK